MSKKLLLDTDILVDFLRGYVKAVNYLKSHSEKFVLSAITVAELYAGIKNDQEVSELDELIALFPILPVTEEIAKKGGLFRQKYCKSHAVGLADGIIAATAVVNKFALKTLNTKHYPMIKGLRAPYTKN